MKKVLTVFIVVVMLFSTCLFASATDDTDTPLTTRNDFLWGQNMHTNTRGHDSPNQYSEEALHLAAKLGIKMLRYQGNYITEDFTECDQIVGLCNKYGIKVMLCLFPNTVDEPTQEDLDMITITTNAYAERYNGKNGKGKVDYFQLWNEEEIKLMDAKYGTGATSGQSTNNYFTISVEGKADLVEWTKNYKAAAKGIREADTDAKIVINFSWVAFGCIKYYVEHGVDFDYIGWDWYAQTYDPDQAEANFNSAMYGGTLKTDNGSQYEVTGLREAIPDKDVIVCESNTWIQGFASHGGYSAENMSLDKYEPFIRQMKLAYKQSWMKGFCAFKLTNSPSHPSISEANYGFVDVEKGGKIIGPRPIYYKYQSLIGGSDSVPLLKKSSVDLAPYYSSNEEDFKGFLNNNPQPDTTNIDTTDNSDNFIDYTTELDDFEIVDDIPDTNLTDSTSARPLTKTLRINKLRIKWIYVIITISAVVLLAAATIIVLKVILKKKSM